MKPRRSNLQALRSSIMGCALLCLIGLILGVVSVNDYRDSRADRQAQLASIAHLKGALIRARADLARARTYSSKYEAIRAEGIVGEFPKTIELDRFEAMIGRQPVTLHRYELSGQIPVFVSNLSDYSPFRPLRHELVFEVHPLHEEHFASMTDWLERELGGLQTIEQCTVSRESENRRFAKSEDGLAKLTAKCKLNWYVFAGPGSSGLGSVSGGRTTRLATTNNQLAR